MTSSIPLEEFLRRLQVEFPGSRAVVEPYTNRSDPIIQHFITLFDLPRATVAADDLRAWEIAVEMYGPLDIPFHLVSHSSEAKLEDPATDRANGSIHEGPP